MATLEKAFVIRTYFKSELVHLYLPQTPINTALRIFRNWLARNSELSRELAAAGYVSSSRIFTPRQVALICRYLGEP